MKHSLAAAVPFDTSAFFDKAKEDDKTGLETFGNFVANAEEENSTTVTKEERYIVQSVAECVPEWYL
jgi:hypothetical protein